MTNLRISTVTLALNLIFAVPCIAQAPAKPQTAAPAAAKRKTITVPVTTLKKYVGTYAITPSMNMMVTLDGNQLMSQMSGQIKAPLVPESSTRFFIKSIDAHIDFIEDLAASGMKAILRKEGEKDLTATRTSNTVLERKEIAMSAEKLARFPGKYVLEADVDLVITLEKEKLMAQITGEPKFRLYPEAENKFFSKKIDAQIEFQNDKEGQVNSATLKQGSYNFKAPKKVDAKK